MKRGEILSGAGKATGKYSQAYNVHDINDGSISWIDLREFELGEETNRETENEEGTSVKGEKEGGQAEIAGMVFREGE